MVSQARVILYLFCANIFLGFFAAILRQLLAANNRFDLQNASILIVLPLSAIGTVVLLKTGHGLVALATLQAVSSFLRCVILFFFAKWRGPSFHLSFGFIRKKTSLELLSFGIFAFIADIGAQLIFYTDSVVIGVFIGVAGITFYNIGLMLVEHGRNIIKQARNVMIPDILKCGGKSNLTETKWLIVKTTRLLMFFAVPLLVGFITLGREFIVLWMGPAYGSSASVLTILAISQFGAIASFACSTTLLGLGRVKFLAGICLAEGILNLCLSIVFVRLFNYGINGIALGTLIPIIGFTSLGVPIYTCRMLKMKVSEFAKGTLFRWLPTALFFAVPCIAAAHLPLELSWLVFLAKVGILAVIYAPIGVIVLFTKEDRASLSQQLRKLVRSLVPKTHQEVSPRG
jgi:O-antigen/teichoic acid export membrane protein